MTIMTEKCKECFEGIYLDVERFQRIMKILITGCCGFIGTNLILEMSKRFDKSIKIYGVDNLTENYCLEFKKDNLKELEAVDVFTFYERDLLENNMVRELLPDSIIHLAAIPGVRKSLDDPLFYIRNNVEAFVKLLEDARKNQIKDVMYASSSSVYGKNTLVPYMEDHPIDSPQSSYACSKKSMEV